MLRVTSVAAAAVATFVLVPAPSGAQHADALRAGPAVAHAATPSVDTVVPRRVPPGAGVARTLTAVVGWAGGAWFGAYGGYQLRAHSGGDFEGLGEALIGASIGGMVGAAAGAAIPQLGSSCGGDRRFGRALGGSAIGSAAGLVGLAAGWPVLVTVPVGSIAGAATGAHGCK